MNVRQQAATVAALTGLAFALRWGQLRGEVPPGTDGYYYVVQAEHLAREGALHVPDSSWVLRLLALPHLLGADPVAGHALASALLAACVVPAAAALGLRAGVAQSLSLAAWAAVSPTVGQLAADFPKSLGLVPPLYLMAAAASRSMLAAVGVGLLAATAHRLGAATIGLVGVGAALEKLSARTLAIGVAAAAGFAVLASLLPGLLHPEDLERVTSQLRPSPWPPPPFVWFSLRSTSLPQALELVLLPWGALVFGLLALREPLSRPALALWLVPLAVTLFPFWRAETLDLGYRLSLLAPIVAAPIAARWARSWTPIALLAAVPWAGSGFDPDSRPPYAEYRAWIAEIPTPRPKLLIMEPSAVFLYDHLTFDHALGWAPEPGLDRTQIFRVVWGIRDGEWAEWAPRIEGVPAKRLDRSHILVREDAWEAFILRANAEGDDDVRERMADPRNPRQPRPASLLRNRPPPSVER